MPAFCDVAQPVPLDQTFTYAVDGAEPVVGGRVLVPFRNLRLSGVVTALHDTKPRVATKKVLEVLDQQPVLDAEEYGEQATPCSIFRTKPAKLLHNRHLAVPVQGLEHQ